ncbi:recombinase RecT [Nostoc ellipsosporum NOK]|nr:recombinase RecT [Nostoc ellipsosporum NOK]
MSNTNTPAVVSAADKMVALKSFMNKESVQEQMKNAVQDNIEPFMASIIDLYSGDNYLQNCSPELVVMQALKAAVLKLPVIKSLGFAYIVPYKSGEKFLPQLQIGYKGLIQLAMRTSQYRIINADVVYEGEYKTRNKLTGEFDLTGEATSDRVIGYFAHFEMLNGFSKTLYMSREKVEAHAKKYSKSYHQPSSPWKTEFDAMALKTTIRGLLSHWGFLSVEMQSALTEEDRDVADQVMQEIQQNGNKKPMGFTNHEDAHMDEEPSFA